MRTSLFVVALVLSGTAHADVTRKVPDFTGVQVAAGIHATVETGAFAPITLRGDDAVLKTISTEVKDGTLYIGWEPNTHLSREGKVTAIVRMPRATSLGVSGGAQMEASVPAGDTFAIAASGGGTLKLTNKVTTKRFSLSVSGGSRTTLAGVDAVDMSIAISGGSRVSFGGKGGSANATLSGAAILDAEMLQVDTLSVEGSGGSRAELRATRQVSGALSGGSRVRVSKSADVRVSLSGGSQVDRDL